MSSLRTSSALLLYGFWSSDLFWTLVFLPGLPPAVRSAIKSWNNKVGIESPGTERWVKVCHYEIYILGGDGVAWGLGIKQITKRRACLPAKSRQSWLTFCYPMDCSHAEWFALETNPDHSVVFEIAPKNCRTLLLTMRAIPLLLQDSCPQLYIKWSSELNLPIPNHSRSLILKL